MQGMCAFLCYLLASNKRGQSSCNHHPVDTEMATPWLPLTVKIIVPMLRPSFGHYNINCNYYQ